jgi:hypothetical protein
VGDAEEKIDTYEAGSDKKLGKKFIDRNFANYTLYYLLLEYAVAQLVEALRYKPEGRGFDSRWCHWNFSLT